MRLTRAALEPEFAILYQRWQQAVRDFHADRILTTSRLLGIPAEQVDWLHIVECRRLHGVPPYEDEAPKITDMPRDKRFRRRMPVR
jgi:hypothetical protein